MTDRFGNPDGGTGNPLKSGKKGIGKWGERKKRINGGEVDRDLVCACTPYFVREFGLKCGLRSWNQRSNSCKSWTFSDGLWIGMNWVKVLEGWQCNAYCTTRNDSDPFHCGSFAHILYRELPLRGVLRVLGYTPFGRGGYYSVESATQQEELWITEFLLIIAVS